MQDDIPVIELRLLHPHRTRKRKFACASCGMTYSLRDYKILYDNQKISYFIDENNPKEGRVCHDCLYRIAMNTKKELNTRKIYVRLDLGDEEIIMTF